MAINHGAPEAGQLTKAWTGGRRERSRQRASGIGSVVGERVENEMRSALHEGSSVLAILVRKDLREGCVWCSKEERKHIEHDGGAQVPQWMLKEPVCRRI